jgi:hypothetical protein
MSKLLVPVCVAMGHDNSTEHPNRFLIRCRRCGRDTTVPYFRRLRSIPYRTERSLVWLANRIAKYRNPLSHWPLYRAIDQHLPGIGTEHSCGAYSYEYIVSLIKQYKSDGLPEPLLKDLISEEGWINLEDNPEMAERVIDELSHVVTLEATKREQEELNKL